MDNSAASFSSSDIAALADRFRVALINGLSGPKAAHLIGTQDKLGRHNLAIVSSVFHVGAHPPLLGMIIRPDSVARHTLANILELGCYTINHVHADMIAQAHQTSARYDRNQSEFSAVELTPQYLADFPAPFVAQSKVKLGMKVAQHQMLEINKTHLVIGEVQWVHVPESAVESDGRVAFEKLASVAVTGLDTYHQLQKATRFAYAKADQPVRQIALSNDT